MIVIYSQDSTFIKKDADDAKQVLIDLYGENLGKEAYNRIYRAPVGTSFRKHGGPLVQVVTEEKARWIEEREKMIAE